MDDSSNQWRCDRCQLGFEYSGDPVLARCPSCDTVFLTRFIQVRDEFAVSLTEHVSLKCKDPSLPSRRKVRREVRSGTRLEGSGSGRLVDEHRLVDHDQDLYEERIIDVKSGKVLRDIREPLSRHRGGSEKS